MFLCRTGWSGSGGIGAEAQWLFLPEPDTRQAKVKGNPTQATLQEILKPLGLRVSVALDQAAVENGLEILFNQPLKRLLVGKVGLFD